MAPPSTQMAAESQDKKDKRTPTASQRATLVSRPRSKTIALFAKPKKKKNMAEGHISIFGRDKGSPVQIRASMAENYEEPITGREGWWRSTIRETPVPGSYEFTDFVRSLSKRPHTYRFKSDGRKTDPSPYHKGASLLPGAYEHQDFLYRLEKSQTTYGFKTTKRDAQDFLNFGKKDKDINVCPTSYKVEDHLTLTTPKQPSKHSMFKSNSSRFPTKYFKPKIGPGPGNYEYSPEYTTHVVSSSFKSKTPRFSTSHTKVPGPGTYEKTFQAPMNNNIAKMGRQHGLFFSSAFQA